MGVIIWRTIIWRTKSFSRRVPSLHTPSTCLWNAVAAVERESAAFNGVYVPLSFFLNVDGAPTLTFNQLGCSQWGLRHVRNVDLYGQWSQCSEHERADCNILGRSQRPRTGAGNHPRIVAWTRTVSAANGHGTHPNQHPDWPYRRGALVPGPCTAFPSQAPADLELWALRTSETYLTPRTKAHRLGGWVWHW